MRKDGSPGNVKTPTLQTAKGSGTHASFNCARSELRCRADRFATRHSNSRSLRSIRKQRGFRDDKVEETRWRVADPLFLWSFKLTRQRDLFDWRWCLRPYEGLSLSSPMGRFVSPLAVHHLCCGQPFGTSSETSQRRRRVVRMRVPVPHPYSVA